jgi:hypothetical protein
LVADAGVSADGIDAVAATLHATLSVIVRGVGLVEVVVAAVAAIVSGALFALRERFVELPLDLDAPTAGATLHPAGVRGGSTALAAAELLSVDGFEEFLERFGVGR